MNHVRSILKIWLPLAAAVTLLCGLVYVIVQQELRLGANQPQIQMAEDTASALAGGQPVTGVVPAGKVELSASLAPFLMVFDPSGRMIASNAVLHGSQPSYPKGALDYAGQHGENRVTWQPEPGVRAASVAVAVPGGAGFVVAGRSLREAESRIDLLGLQVGAGWLVTLAVTLVLTAVLEFLLRERS